VGGQDRSLRLLATQTLAEIMTPANTLAGPAMAAGTSLRDAMAELMWQGADRLTVVDGAGKPIGAVTLSALLKQGSGA
jgi:osmoprotectant transport system ATP-binding protein